MKCCEIVKMQSQKLQNVFTEHGEFGDLALPLPHHVRSNADVFPRVALPGVGDHQLATANLKESTETIMISLRGGSGGGAQQQGPPSL